MTNKLDHILAPPALQKGDMIGVMATSCWLKESDLLASKAFFEAQGYKIFIHPQATNRLNQSAGTAQSKIDALHDLFLNKEIKAIFGARGGNRAITMMDGLDMDIIRNNPKIVMGYSDMTVLLNGIFHQTGLIGFHGPLFREMPKRPESAAVMAVLAGEQASFDLVGSRIINAGEAQGRLIGGNLSLLQTLSGTSFKPDTNGAILFLEDIGDHISRYDRMLAHLKLAGWLDGLRGIICGDFSNMKDDEDRPFGFTLEDIIREHTSDLDIPIVMDAPFGHGDALPCFPVGAMAKLSAQHELPVTLELTARAVLV
jgi:muramoyltetrapeptide carboxypeptidase